MGLENIEAIAVVDGIDLIAYGRSDLSARLGVHLQLEHPTFKATVRRSADVRNAPEPKGIANGVHVRAYDEASRVGGSERVIDDGMTAR